MVGSCGFGIPVESLHRELGDRTGGQEPDKRLSRAKGNGAGVGEREKGTSEPARRRGGGVARMSGDLTDLRN